MTQVRQHNLYPSSPDDELLSTIFEQHEDDENNDCNDYDYSVSNLNNLNNLNNINTKPMHTNNNNYNNHNNHHNKNKNGSFYKNMKEKVPDIEEHELHKSTLKTKKKRIQSFFYIPAIYLIGIGFLLSLILLYFFFRRRLKKMDTEIQRLQTIISSLQNLNTQLQQQQQQRQQQPPPFISQYQQQQQQQQHIPQYRVICEKEEIRRTRDIPHQQQHVETTQTRSEFVIPSKEKVCIMRDQHHHEEMYQETNLKNSKMGNKLSSSSSKILTPSEMDKALERELEELDIATFQKTTTNTGKFENHSDENHNDENHNDENHNEIHNNEIHNNEIHNDEKEIIEVDSTMV